MTMPNVEAAPPPSLTAEEAAAIRQMIVSAAQNGEGAPMLRALLKHVTLSPEQQLFVDTLLDAPAHAARTPGPAVVAAVEDDETAELRAELADLRQANDTMASALGACPYCWGGDVVCRVCRGRGRPGYAPPDPALFHQFVVPALRRVRAEQSTAGRGGGGSRRARE